MTTRLESPLDLQRRFRADPEAVLAETQRSLSDATASQTSLNAFTCIADTDAVSAATESQQRHEAGRAIGPLDGVPITVKDSFHVAGLPRWHGSAIATGAVSSHDSAPVRRLKEAGAVIIGKTTMPDFGMLASGMSSQFGITRNPWDTSLSPGGSSSGAAASLAAGITPLAIGTDIAGSVRLPAAHCGLAALKPTQGRIAYAPSSAMRSAGPMARSVGDLVELFSIIGRPDAEDPWCLPSTPKANIQPPAPGTRIGVLTDLGYGLKPDAETAATLARSVDALTALGYECEPITPGLRSDDFMAIDRVLRVKAITELIAAPADRQSSALQVVREWAAAAASLSASDLELAHHRIAHAVERFLTATARVRYIVSPIVPVHSFAAESYGPRTAEALLDHTQFTAWFNQTGEPALALAGGISPAGLPLGIQLAGKRFDDDGVLGLGLALETALNLTLNWPTTHTTQQGDAA